MSKNSKRKKWLGVSPWIIIGSAGALVVILVVLFVPMFSSNKIIEVTDTIMVKVEKQVPVTVTEEVTKKVYVGYMQEQGQYYGGTGGVIILGEGPYYGGSSDMVGGSADRGRIVGPTPYYGSPGRRYQIDAGDEIVDYQQQNGPDGSLTLTLTDADGKQTVYRYIDTYDLTKTGEIKVPTQVTKMNTVYEEKPQQITRQQVVPTTVNLIQLISGGAEAEQNKIWCGVTTGTVALLGGVHGTSSSDIFISGADGTILHHDGKTWVTMTSGTTNALWALWGSGSDMFTVGPAGTILYYNGRSWGLMTSGATENLWEVWGLSPSDVFAVGDNGVILHYDGKGWGRMTSGTTNHLGSVWASSPTDVFVAGNNGTILHYDGKGWGIMTTGTTADLWEVWGESSSNVFASGRNGTILYYNGKTWGTMTSGTTVDLSGIWGISGSNVFAVGAGGTVTFRFTAVAKGQATLKLTYHRPFEKNVPALKSCEVTINVKK